MDLAISIIPEVNKIYKIIIHLAKIKISVLYQRNKNKSNLQIY